MVHTRQSRPDSGLFFRVKVFKILNLCAYFARRQITQLRRQLPSWHKQSLKPKKERELPLSEYGAHKSVKARLWLDFRVKVLKISRIRSQANHAVAAAVAGVAQAEPETEKGERAAVERIRHT